MAVAIATSLIKKSTTTFTNHNGELSPPSSAPVINEVLPGALEKQYEEDEQRNGVDEEAVAIPDIFKAMTNDKKWKLSTGKYVEDVLYDLGVKCKYHNIKCTTPKLGKDFNMIMDFQYEHVRTTVADWIHLYETISHPLCMEMPESWYCIHVWWTIDIAFSDLPYTFLISGKKACLASSKRKNRLRTLSNLKKCNVKQ
ncbi:3234_t:CDS:2 [Entrophospora sp. SA101]|nr:3234_t:CDS:2 [Entrophospora sp. SA101]